MSSSSNNFMNGSAGSSSEAVSEGARRATAETASGAPCRDPEVFAVGRRRQFSGSEKRALLAEADRRKAAGTLGAFLREKHIYSSMLSSWRKQLGAADRVAPRAEAAGAEARCLGPPDAAAHTRQCAAAAQARAGGADHRGPKKTMRGSGAADLGRSDRGGVMRAVAELAPHIGMSSACEAFALNRGFVYRDRVRHRAGSPRCVPRAAATASLGALECRAGDPARCARQRALHGRGAGDRVRHLAR